MLGVTLVVEDVDIHASPWFVFGREVISYNPLYHTAESHPWELVGLEEELVGRELGGGWEFV